MPDNKDYTIGWISALSVEYAAAQAFLDEKHEGPEDVPPNDNNDYTLGRIGKHCVVIAVLPDGEYGMAPAANVARDMLHSFPNVRIGLLVGIGGGAPSQKNDIRLGDIVVCSSKDGKGAVFGYDFGKTIQNQQFQPTSFLNQPPSILRTAVNGLKTKYMAEGHKIEEEIQAILREKPRLRRNFSRPDADSDRLFVKTCVHPHDDDEASCAEACANDKSQLISRRRRTQYEDNPMIHYGLIASGNSLMKDALIRDRLIAQKEVLCFETEAAGLINHFPCLVIRGICDYSDTHKNDLWQGYASMTAAAYAKDLLYRIAPKRVEAEKKIGEVLTDMDDKISDISKGLDKLLCSQDDEEHQAILSWLTTADSSHQQSDFIGRQQSGTGEWLLNAVEFQQWVCQDAGLLFCHGIPGVGKTIATSIVVDHLLRKFRNDSGIGISYLYCTFAHQNQQDPTHLLLALLKELARTFIPKPVVQLYQYHAVRGTRPSFDEVLETLRGALSYYRKSYVVIDALDECKASGGVRSRFLSALFYLNANTNTSLFATSRLVPDVQEEFYKLGASILEIRASDEDIGKYINAHMYQLPSFVRECPDLGVKVKRAVVSAADGMFLLAILHFESLEDKTSIRQVENALEDLPKGLDSYNKAYEGAMERILAQKKGLRDLAIQTISWLTCAEWPLSTSELQHALAVLENASEPPDERDITEVRLIVTVCAGLVTVDTNSNVIRLIHYTTQEYFQRNLGVLFPNAQNDIARTCVTYLSLDTFESGFCVTDETFEERLRLNPLYLYAAMNWGKHLRTSSLDGEQLVLDFLESKPKVSACSQGMMPSQIILGQRQTCRTQMTGLHLAAFFGLTRSAEALVGMQHPLDLKDNNGLAPLTWAAYFGHTAVVELLVNQGAHLESQDRRYGQTPLFWATVNGEVATAELLMDKGASLEHKNKKYGQTPLLWALQHGSFVMAELLINKGADVNSQDRNGRTPISWAVANGAEQIIKLLLLNRANPDSQDYSGRNPLSYAAERGHDEIAKILLKKKATLDCQDSDGRTPLAYAAMYGQAKATRLLLQKGASVKCEDKGGRTPLSLVPYQGNRAIARLLIDYGAELEAIDESSYTPLLWAAFWGNEEVAKELVDSGASINGHGPATTSTPLSVGEGKWSDDFISFLESRGAQRAARGSAGPLWARLQEEFQLAGQTSPQ